MGSFRYYIRVYAANELVRTFGGSKKKIYQMIKDNFPHIYNLAPLPQNKTSLRDPTMIMMWKLHRKSGVRELQWVIRGFEEYEIYRPTTIFVPMSPLYFEEGAHRDQSHCFMKLLKKKYKVVSYDAFRQIFWPYTDCKKVEGGDPSLNERIHV